MILSEAYAAFMTSRVLSGHSPKTIAHYHSSIGTLVRQAGEEAPLTQQTIDEFFIWLATGTELTPISRHTYSRGIRAFVNWTASEGLTGPIKTPSIRLPQTAIIPLGADEVRSLLKQFDQRRFAGIRNYTITLLLYDTGVRLNEALSLVLSDIDWGDQFILIRQGKGQKDRWVPYSRILESELKRYIKSRSRQSPIDDSLWINRGGSILKMRAYQTALSKVGQKVKTHARVSAHTLRHSFALSYVESGGDPYSLQRILGHASQSMTAKYVNMGRNNLRSAHNRFSPLATANSATSGFANSSRTHSESSASKRPKRQ